MKANTFQVEVDLEPAATASSALSLPQLCNPQHSRHSGMFDPTSFQHTILFVQIDVPEGIPVDEVMKRFKNESRRVNTVMEVRPCTKPFRAPFTLP